MANDNYETRLVDAMEVAGMHFDGIINNGDRGKDEEEKKPSVLEKLQEKKKEATEAEASRPKLPKKDKAQDVDLS